MAVGAAVQGLVSKAQNEFLDMQPGAGIEWIIHNIYHENNIELYIYDGTNQIKIDSDSGYGAMYGLCIHCTNTKYLRIKSTYASAQLIGYDGIITKE